MGVVLKVLDDGVVAASSGFIPLVGAGIYPAWRADGGLKPTLREASIYAAWWLICRVINLLLTQFLIFRVDKFFDRFFLLGKLAMIIILYK